MASAYAALVSLMNTITMETTPGRHPHHQITIDGELMEALEERINFLVEFLEGGWKGSEDLEGRIADAAHAAEHAIELYVADEFLARYKSSGESTTKDSTMSSLNTLMGTFQDLGKIIQEMDMIKNEVVQIKEKCGLNDLHLESSTSAIPSSASLSGKINMVGFEDDKIQIMEELTSWNSSRTIISIVGMGGSGKTTLARNIYDDKLIVQYFDIRAWITISQEYNVKDIFIGILSATGKQGFEHLYNIGDENLGEPVHKEFSGRRYLVVLDDIWSINVWDKIKRYFPDNCNGSRIMVTSRLSSIAKQLSTCSFGMRHLNEDNSWNLLCKIVFAQNNCPLELVDVGKKIAQNCKGLPLAIVVVGGLLAKFSKRVEYWKDVAQLSDDAQHCSKILSLSYNHLPVQLKPCFLYFGMFQEDHEIRITELINLWVAEGFLKPLRGKNMEEIAKEYIVELIERNLIMVHKWGASGNIESCVIHDLLRGLCLREAKKENFFCVMSTTYHSLSKSCRRRIVVNIGSSDDIHVPRFNDFLLSTPHVRTLIVNNYDSLPNILGFPVFKLLRVFFGIGNRPKAKKCISEVLSNLVNLRFLTCMIDRKFNDMFASSIGLLRNLQILVVGSTIHHVASALSEILNLSQLRHIWMGDISFLPPSFGEQEYDDSIILQNLQTLVGLKNFTFHKGVLKKIPNIKEMRIKYWKCEEWSDRQICNLRCLQKLESFHCGVSAYEVNLNEFLQNLAFLHSLKSLSLSCCRFLRADLTVIGSLLHLEVLSLSNCIFIGSEWSPIEGEFLHLKSLCMNGMALKCWNADSTHFPCLEQLGFSILPNLKEIPLDIGEIATLRLIQLEDCSHSLVISAKRILEEQQSLGIEGLVIKVIVYRESKELRCLQSRNFLIEQRSI